MLTDVNRRRLLDGLVLGAMAFNMPHVYAMATASGQGRPFAALIAVTPDVLYLVARAELRAGTPRPVACWVASAASLTMTAWAVLPLDRSNPWTRAAVSLWMLLVIVLAAWMAERGNLRNRGAGGSESLLATRDSARNSPPKGSRNSVAQGSVTSASVGRRSVTSSARSSGDQTPVAAPQASSSLPALPSGPAGEGTSASTRERSRDSTQVLAHRQARAAQRVVLDQLDLADVEVTAQWARQVHAAHPGSWTSWTACRQAMRREQERRRTANGDR